ncbi:MAG: hypothetical protein AB1465_06935 [Patescibacteria group bacterium]
MTNKITIDDLYSDVGTFDQEGVLTMLKGKVVFTKENEVLFTVDPTKLKARHAILLYALAKKVLKANNKIDDEIITNAEILDKAKLTKSNVGVTIMRLKDKKILMPSGSGYELPTFKVAEVLNSLKDNKD